MSFKAIKPYVYSIPLGVDANEYFPLAIVLGISEGKELYELFYDAMHTVGVGEVDLDSKPVLSDQEASLMAIGQSRIHSWCIRYLSEKFGCNSIQGEIADRLTFCSTPDHFINGAYACSLDISILIQQRRITFDQLQPHLAEFGLGETDGQIVITYNLWERRALPNRAAYGVGSCSSHAEGFHREINKAVSGYRCSVRCLGVIVQCIEAGYRKACATHRRRVYDS
jgi:hypothetical protein